jgi:tripeptidyl-peptidase-2
VGSLTLGQVPNGGGNGGRPCPASAQIAYLAPPKRADPPGGNGGGNGGGDSEEEALGVRDRLAESLRDARVKFLRELKCESEEEKAAYAQLQAQLLADFPGHLPLLLEALQRAQKAAAASAKNGGGGDGAAEGGEQGGTSNAAPAWQAVVAAADAVVGAIDATELAVHLARKCAEEGPGSAKRKKGERGGAAAAERRRCRCCCRCLRG